MICAYVGLGANLGERAATMRRALKLLGDGRAVEIVAVSSFRETDPVGLLEQPRFLNAAAALDTELGAAELLERLLDVERRLGRTRDGPPLGPRTIDLDLLLYGQEVVRRAGLEVPHPRLYERRFALEPLAELDPSLVVPGRGSVSALLSSLDSTSCRTSTISTSSRPSSSSG